MKFKWSNVFIAKPALSVKESTSGLDYEGDLGCYFLENYKIKRGENIVFWKPLSVALVSLLEIRISSLLKLVTYILLAKVGYFRMFLHLPFQSFPHLRGKHCSDIFLDALSFACSIHVNGIMWIWIVACSFFNSA